MMPPDCAHPTLFDPYLSPQARVRLAGCPCAHCGRSSSPDHDWYMVSDTVWAAAGFESYEFACLGCLEQRLGRPLVADDFPDVLANHWGILSTPTTPSRGVALLASEEPREDV